MPAASAARKNAASSSGMKCSGIEMPAFEAVISCDTAGLVGGAAGNLIRKLAGPAARNIAARGSGMLCSGIPQSVDLCQKKECDS